MPWVRVVTVKEAMERVGATRAGRAPGQVTMRTGAKANGIPTTGKGIRAPVCAGTVPPIPPWPTYAEE